MKKITKTGLYILLAMVILLAGIRLAIPFYVKKLVNAQLQQIDPYRGSVGDIDLLLIAGAYSIDDLVIVKQNGDKEEPFVTIPRVDFSIEWRSLFHGSIVGEVEVFRPQFNFIFAKSYQQTGSEVDWVDLVKDLMPIQINRFAIDDGEVKMIYRDEDIAIASEFKECQLEITNIRNVEDQDDALPSTIRATAYAPMYKGDFEFSARANLLKLIPDMDFDAQFENVELVSLNPLMKQFTNMDFEGGKLDLYSEMVITDGNIDGYVKPILTDAMIYRSKEEDRSFLSGVKEFFAEGVQEVFQNREVNTTATKMPVTGTVENARTVFWPTLISMIRNAYWQAILKRIDDTIEFGSRENAKSARKSDKKAKETRESRKSSRPEGTADVKFPDPSPRVPM